MPTLRQRKRYKRRLAAGWETWGGHRKLPRQTVADMYSAPFIFDESWIMSYFDEQSEAKNTRGVPLRVTSVFDLYSDEDFDFLIRCGSQ